MTDKDILIELESQKRSVKALSAVFEMCDRKPKCVEERVLQAYIRHHGATDASKVLNDEGLRLKSEKGERKYYSSDITGLIRDDSTKEKVSPDLMELTLFMCTRGQRYTGWTQRLVEGYYKTIENGDV